MDAPEVVVHEVQRNGVHMVLYLDETWRAEGEVEEPAIAGRRPGEAGDASRRKVIVGAVSHRIGVRRGGRRTNRGVITCRVMRVHFGVTIAEMHHEHSDTPTRILPWDNAAYWD